MQYPVKAYEKYTIQIEKIEHCALELVRLHKDYWDEINGYKMPFNPNYEILHKLETAGEFFQITVRKNRELIGCCGFYIYENIHTSLKTAGETFLFLKKEHRKGMLAHLIINYAIPILASMGVEESSITLDINTKLDKTLQRIGLVKVATNYKINKETLRNKELLKCV